MSVPSIYPTPKAAAITAGNKAAEVPQASAVPHYSVSAEHAERVCQAAGVTFIGIQDYFLRSGEEFTLIYWRTRYGTSLCLFENDADPNKIFSLENVVRETALSNLLFHAASTQQVKHNGTVYTIPKGSI